jgi:hypothetical protein
VAVTAYVSYFALFFCAAASQLTFASDNRSTALRICMLVQHTLLAGWVAFFIVEERSNVQVISIGPPLAIWMILACVHWYVMGMFLTGESPHLSPRVQRTLPKTSAGRTFLSWFFPGPGRGYVFVLANLTAAVVMALFSMVVWESIYPRPLAIGPVNFERLFGVSLLCLAYTAFYLGLAKLILAWLRRYSVSGALTNVLVNVLLVLIGCGVPLVMHLMSDLRMAGYNLLHVFNPFWSIAEVAERSTLYFPAILSIVSIASLVVFALNLRSLLAEVRLVRASSPARVADEEALWLAAQKPSVKQPRDPWDEGA